MIGKGLLEGWVDWKGRKELLRVGKESEGWRDPSEGGREEED